MDIARPVRHRAGQPLGGAGKVGSLCAWAQTCQDRSCQPAVLPAWGAWPGLWPFASSGHWRSGTTREDRWPSWARNSAHSWRCGCCEVEQRSGQRGHRSRVSMSSRALCVGAFDGRTLCTGSASAQPPNFRYPARKAGHRAHPFGVDGLLARHVGSSPSLRGLIEQVVGMARDGYRELAEITEGYGRDGVLGTMAAHARGGRRAGRRRRPSRPHRAAARLPGVAAARGTV